MHFYDAAVSNISVLFDLLIVFTKFRGVSKNMLVRIEDEAHFQHVLNL
jgi:hypothetical protein